MAWQKDVAIDISGDTLLLASTREPGAQNLGAGLLINNGSDDDILFARMSWR